MFDTTENDLGDCVIPVFLLAREVCHVKAVFTLILQQSLETQKNWKTSSLILTGH